MEKYGNRSTKNWNLAGFKAPLDHYLNTELNLTNLCLFLRFYRVVNEDRIKGESFDSKAIGSKNIKNYYMIFKEQEVADLG